MLTTPPNSDAAFSLAWSPSVAPAGNAHAQTEHASLQRLAALTELVASVSASSSEGEACQILAEQLQSYCGAAHVAVGTFSANRPRFELRGLAHATDTACTAETTSRFVAAAHECAAREESGCWPPSPQGKRHALAAHRQLADALGASAVYTWALHDAQGTLRGVCVLAGTKEALDTADHQHFCSAACIPLGSALGLLSRAHGHQIDRLLQHTRSALDSHPVRWCVLATAVMASLLCILLPYQVSCRCELQPVIRRYIAAPFDARLESNAAQPGDLVQAGQLLAKVDARDVGWELSAKQAEAQRVATELAGHVARHELAESELASLELQRLELTIEQLQHQMAQLEICSPLAGIVLMGDHAKNEGIPLKQGDTLFEIAPLEQMLVELEIPEDDIRFIRVGMPVRVGLDAFPQERFSGVVHRIYPVAELKEQSNVFIAEMQLANTSGQLRPGMHGHARITTMPKSMAWNLFHKPWTAAWSWVGW